MIPPVPAGRRGPDLQCQQVYASNGAADHSQAILAAKSDSSRNGQRGREVKPATPSLALSFRNILGGSGGQTAPHDASDATKTALQIGNQVV
jgi:hypothetical protein